MKKNCIKLGLTDLPCPALPCPNILCLVIFDNWETWLKLAVLEHVQACLYGGVMAGKNWKYFY